uniref:Uncharacterized protein n=1 Tax=Arundo donax TaxID=35708 RepID=A0A0A8Y3R6_ARUDO
MGKRSQQWLEESPFSKSQPISRLHCFLFYYINDIIKIT